MGVSEIFKEACGTSQDTDQTVVRLPPAASSSPLGSRGSIQSSLNNQRARYQHQKRPEVKVETG